MPNNWHIRGPDGKLTNADLKTIRKKIKDLGMWRNALAHGLITVSESDDSMLYLNYYAQSQQQKELDDAFWKQLEDLMGALADFFVPARMWMEINTRRMRKARHEQKRS